MVDRGAPATKFNGAYYSVPFPEVNMNDLGRQLAEMKREAADQQRLLGGLAEASQDHDRILRELASPRDIRGHGEEKSTDYKCFVCGKETKGRCGVCRRVFYCSGACQKGHWRVHKKQCGK